MIFLIITGPGYFESIVRYWSVLYATMPRGYKNFFMLKSIEHGIFPAH